VLGAYGLHQKNFVLFLAAVLVAAASTIAVFVATSVTSDAADA
jgi:hypothetical protein